jgi:glycosyltransferase involved in cell wall biosynthesis
MITDFYLPTLGGVQTSVKAQKDALTALGHEVTVFAPAFKAFEDPTEVKLPIIRPLRIPEYPIAGLIPQVKKTLRRYFDEHGNPDVVHIHSDAMAGVAGIIVAKQRGIPIVQSMHTREDVFIPTVAPMGRQLTVVLERMHNHYISHEWVHIPRDWDGADSRAARRMWRIMVSHVNVADHVVVPSDHLRRRLVKFGMNAPATVISNGIRNDALALAVDAPVRHLEPGEKLRIVWCGRVSADTRPLEFLEACWMLPANRFQVDMYGDGFQMHKVQRFIEDRGLGGRVNVHGGVPQPQVLQAMLDGHVFAQTSYRFDTQGMTLLEAMYTGLPAVYCDPDLGESLPVDGRLLTKDPSPEGIAAALTSLIENPERIASMSQAMLDNRASATQQAHTAALVSVYEQVLDKGKR